MLMFCGPQDAPLAMRQQLVELKRTLRRHAPEQNGRGLIPFARDLRQNLLCLDFGDGFEESMPGVVYLDHSATADGAEPFYPVAPTFQEFLTQLRDEPSSQSERLVEAEITGYLD
ncbi:hypothetical protein CKO28_06170 [Rhodovibrio sodomensis]|uniref:Knr4/Smi1-like domain-containing protein n=1 Tax=Rhodovibrio sodomensis TaxID=1088 RepID=A0ABS1DAY7_9PROT|nr:SMI1/KNR4 family protein [Rhodovibrio sodomensis]MBK1667618.1 hypothetical protein [Rhodovibrio sodomensis]